MNSLIKPCVLIGSLIAIFGCASTYVPRPGSINPASLPDVQNSKTVALVNAQPSSQIVEIGNAGMGRSLSGNLQEWTDRAIELTTKTLVKKGFTISNDSPNVLELAIANAFFESAAGGWGFMCTVSLDVDTGDGQHVPFVGQKVDWKFAGSCDKAFTEAVSVMLADERVQHYLTR